MTARNRFERQVRKTRTRFERELRQRRSRVERTVKQNRRRFEREVRSVRRDLEKQSESRRRALREARLRGAGAASAPRSEPTSPARRPRRARDRGKGSPASYPRRRMQHPLLPQPPGRHGSGAPSVFKPGLCVRGAPAASAVCRPAPFGPDTRGPWMRRASGTRSPGPSRARCAAAPEPDCGRMRPGALPEWTHAHSRTSNRLAALRHRPRAPPRHRRARDGPLDRRSTTTASST